MCPDSTGSRGEEPEDLGALGGPPNIPRPFGPRPYGPRPYGPRPYGPRPYGPRGDAPPSQPTPYGPRPYGPRPYGPRPYGPRPYGPRGEPPDGYLDPDEWSEDVADLFCAESAVVRLGGRVVCDEDDLPVAAVEPPLGRADYVDQPKATDPRTAEEPIEKVSAAKPEARVSERHLHPRCYELAVKVVIPNALARTLVEYPEVAWALKQDLAGALAFRADQAFLHGPGGTPPLGITRTAATIALPPPPPGAAPRGLLQTVRDMVGELRRGGQARFGNAGWILHPVTLEALSRLLTANGQVEGAAGWGLEAVLLLQHDGHDGGVLLGYPFVVSSATDEAGTIRIHFSSDWSEAWIGADRQLVTVDVSVDVHFQTDETVIRAVMHHDFVVRRPKCFVYEDAP